MVHTNTDTYEFKASIFQPMIDRWNEISPRWFIEKDPFSEAGAVIRSEAGDSIHGILAKNIACLCEPFSWTWAIYPTHNGHLEVRIH